MIAYRAIKRVRWIVRRSNLHASQLGQGSVSAPLVPMFDESGLCLLESQHTVDFHMDWTRHPYTKVLTVLRGSGVVELRSEGAKYVLKPGKIVAVFPNTCHRLRDAPRDPMLLYILCIGSNFPFATTLFKGHKFSSVQDPALVGRMLRIVKEIALITKTQSTRGLGNSGQLLRTGLTAVLLAQFLQAKNPKGGSDSCTRVREFVCRLKQEFFLPRTIDDAAAEVQMSRRRFTQLFSNETGRSYQRHIQRLRIEHACRILSADSVSPLTVAFQVGYEDVSTFYRAFKNEMGFPPCQWLSYRKASKRAKL